MVDVLLVVVQSCNTSFAYVCKAMCNLSRITSDIAADLESLFIPSSKHAINVS